MSSEFPSVLKYCTAHRKELFDTCLKNILGRDPSQQPAGWKLYFGSALTPNYFSKPLTSDDYTENEPFFNETTRLPGCARSQEFGSEISLCRSPMLTSPLSSPSLPCPPDTSRTASRWKGRISSTTLSGCSWRWRWSASCPTLANSKAGNRRSSALLGQTSSLSKCLCKDSAADLK